MAEDPEPTDDGGTVDTEPAAPVDADASAPGEAAATGRRSAGPDRRTIAISVCLGLVAALLVGLVASFAIGDDPDPTQGMELQEPGKVNTEKLLSQPLETADGGTTDLAAFQEGKPMLVNLFASNCPPCVREMPLLTAAQEANPGITFVGVATQDPVEKAEALVERTNIEYPWALDPSGEFYFETKGTGMPTTLLLAADGTVIDRTSGEFHNESELRAFLDQAR